MTREFKTPDYEATLNPSITLREALPLNLYWLLPASDSDSRKAELS